MSAEQATRGWRGITVEVQTPGGRIFRPACFVVDTPGGFTWVEPSYFEPPVSAPAAHEVVGTIEEYPRTLVFDGSLSGELRPYDPDSDRALIGGALDWWLDEFLPASGKSIDEHRAEAAALLGDPP